MEYTATVIETDHETNILHLWMEGIYINSAITRKLFVLATIMGVTRATLTEWKIVLHINNTYCKLKFPELWYY